MTATTLRLLRDRRRLSLRALAREVQIAHQHLHAFEHGLTPWPAARRKLAAFYGLREDEL